MRRTASTLVLLSAVAIVAYAQSSTPIVSNQPLDTGVIRGRVLAADTDTPLGNARVQAISDKGSVPPVFTDRDGQFEMRTLPPGLYRLSASKAGYISTTSAERSVGNSGAAIAVSNSSAAVIDLRMAKGSAISGRIADTQGDPLIGMTVTAARSGDPLQPIATSETDDRGEYRIGDLRSGQYVVSVTSMSALLTSGTIFLNQNTFGGAMRAGRALTPSETASQVRVYYPGVQRIDAALPIPLTVGEERTNVDFIAPAQPPIDSFGALTSKATPSGAPSNFTGVIRGQVVVDGRPCPQVTVRVVPDDLPSVPPAVVTDADGRYEFRRLASATFKVIALKPGFLPTEYGQITSAGGGQPIEVRPGETRDRVDIALLHPSVITGRLMDENGDPVEHVSIHLLQVRYRDGRRRLVESGGLGTRHTDDRGVYRVYGLQPGDYIVSAGAGPVDRAAASLLIADVPGHTVTYYPGISNPGDAQRVPLGVGTEASGLDFALARAPTARISGTIVDAMGNPVQSGLILAPSRRSGVLATDPIAASQFPDGRFEFSNVAPGEYVIQAVKRDSRNERSLYGEGESVSQFVSMSGSDITGLNLRMTSGSTVTGRISFEGDAGPELYTAVNLSAVPVDFDRTPQILGFPASAEVQSDLTFKLTGLSGARVLRLFAPPPGWILKTVRLNGRDITDTPVIFGGPDRSVGGLEVVLSNRAGEITGQVLDARGRAATGATVVIFSTDRREWADSSRFMAISRSVERNSAFRITNVTPGDYYVVALTALLRDEWRDPDFLELLVPIATHITVSEDERVTVGLRVVTP